jgi:prepilin-type N-terminal cleavage/methylation domain-containing protein
MAHFRRIRFRSHRRAGFTLLELMTGTTILAVSLLSMLGLVGASYGVSRSAHEQTQAREAAVRKLEQIRELARSNFSQLLTTYSASPTNGARNFAVGSLAPVPGDADGMPGQVTVTPSAVGGTKLVDVTVRIDWRGTNGNRSFQIDSRLSGN